MRRIAFALAAVLAAPWTAVAQHDQHAAVGDQLGTVHFETSCAPLTRADFDRAIALLHSFEYRPAMESLTKVLAADSSCAIAYWGLALSQRGNPFAGVKAGPLLERGQDAAQKGLATGTPTPREKAYLAAVSELDANAATVPHRERTLAYARAVEAVQRDNPADVEAQIFYALAVNQTAGVMAEALHAMDYQAYAYLQMAQDQKARAVLARVPGVVAKLDVNAIGGAAPGIAGIYARNAIAARHALERGAWAAAAALEVIPSTFPYADAITHFARALGAARSGKPAAAKPDVDRLILLREALPAAKDPYWTEQVDIQRQVATAWITFAEGNTDDGLRQMRAAADAEDATDKAAISPGPIAPARELLGEMLLEAGAARDALAAFEATMVKEPKRFRGAYGAAKAAETAGDRARAVTLYAQVVAIAKTADGGRPELTRARAFVR